MLESINSYTKVVEEIAGKFADNPYVHIDVGCSGGMHSVINVFGDNLKAVGFDPDIQEIRRLNEANKSAQLHHIASFVTGGGDVCTSHLTRNPWGRLSAAMRFDANNKSEKETPIALIPDEDRFADPNLSVFLPDYFDEQGLEYVDFIKIDVDGQDFNILKSLSNELSSRHVLGVAIEVNYVGSHLSDEHTFHNVDRFMREQGFDLFGLEVRAYSAAALPFPYRYDFPGNTIKGRPLQGDALYFRDLCAEHSRGFAGQLSAKALLKAVALMSLCNLPDSCAEIVLGFRDKLGEIVCTETLLNLLAEEVQVLSGNPKGMSFAEYQEAFARSDDYFWPNVRK